MIFGQRNSRKWYIYEKKKGGSGMKGIITLLLVIQTQFLTNNPCVLWMNVLFFGFLYLI